MNVGKQCRNRAPKKGVPAGTVLYSPSRGLLKQIGSALPLFFVGGTGEIMLTTEMLRHRLCSLGWKILDDARQADDGSWFLIAQSCGHNIVALADTEQEVWLAACAMAMKLTRGAVRP